MAIKELLSGGISGVLDSAKGLINQFVPDPKQKAEAIQALTNEANRHEEALISKANELEQSYLKDKENARNSNVSIQLSDKASWWAKNTGYFLDVFIGLIWGTMTIFLLAKALKLVDNVNADLTAVLSLYSTVTAVFMICVQFHRGSSVGSRENGKRVDEMIKRM